MGPEDHIRIRHMLDAVMQALAFVEGRARADLDADRMLLLALVKCIEILGEAASKVSPEVRQASPDIPWRSIVAMRNRLIHGYFDINADMVWATVVEVLPSLNEPLTKLGVLSNDDN